MAVASPRAVHADLVGTAIDVNAMNFPSNGSGQIVLNNGPQRLGESGLTVDARTSTLSTGDELLEVWWSNEEDAPNGLANDVNSPSFAGFTVGPAGARPLTYSKFLVSMTRDGVPVAPSNPFGLPPLNNIGPHTFGQDFSILELSGPPPGGFRYDEQRRLSIGLLSGLFVGQTFYHAGNVPPTQGGTPPPFGDVGGLDMFGYSPIKSEIDGIYNAWVIRQALIGDTNLDDTVGFDDFLTLSDNYDRAGGWEAGDFDGDGKVQFSDFVLLSANYGTQRSAVAAVPEPSSWVLCSIALLWCNRRRSRKSS